MQFFPPSGQGFYLQSLVNGNFVTAKVCAINGTPQTLFIANEADTTDSLTDAALFAYYEMEDSIWFFWQNPASGNWHGLTYLDTPEFGGVGVLAASTTVLSEPFELEWTGIRQPIQWKIEPPGGWTVNHGANLAWVDFTLLGWSEFPFDFSYCTLDYANLTGLSFGNAIFAFCDLHLATVSPPLGASESAWIDFTNANINFSSLGTDWRYLNLTSAAINGLPSSLDDALGPINASGTLLDEVDLSNTSLGEANFSGASLVNTDLNGSYLSKAVFTGATLAPTESGNLVAANLSGSYLYEADFSNANAMNVSFSGAFVFGDSATFSGANLRGADFQGAYLAECDFTGIYEKDLVGAVFDNACLVNANFNGTQLGKIDNVGFSFVGAALQGADFADSNLEGANLSDAALSEGSGTLTITACYYFDNQTFQPVTSISFQGPTILAPTDQTTYCPSGMGPCVGRKLNPANSSSCPSETWPVES